jgi:hypothetical protein
MTDQLAPAYGWLPLVAEHARNASRDSGPCPVCQRLLARGLRICDLAQGGAVVHVSCADRAAVVSPPAITAGDYGPDETRTDRGRQQNRTARRDIEHRSETTR